MIGQELQVILTKLKLHGELEVDLMGQTNTAQGCSRHSAAPVVKTQVSFVITHLNLNISLIRFSVETFWSNLVTASYKYRHCVFCITYKNVD